MRNNIMNKIRSDKAASNSTETIIIIALAVFAALALFTFVLKPVQEGAEKTGDTIEDVIGNLLDGKSPDGTDILNP